jgi:hypothetical protein
MAASQSQHGAYGFDASTALTSLLPDPSDSSNAYVIRGARLYRVEVPKRRSIAWEYRFGDRFWITANAAEAGALGFMGYHPNRTGQRFGLWSPAQAPAGALGACRFQGNPAYGQSSRFIALAGFECDIVKGSPAFVLEGENEYFALPPDARDACAAGLVPVRRFNNLQSNVNHRYVADAAGAAEMRAAGWYDEGVRMCARPLGADE